MTEASRGVKTITNARFLSIGDRQVCAGTLDGKTFYSDPIQEIDGNIIRTEKESFRYSKDFH